MDFAANSQIFMEQIGMGKAMKMVFVNKVDSEV
jgi:hypothetical protein